ncbi:uncharacterized protein LOC105441631 [Strongylocentrotus purpuratus]|uniref:DED domain-containing protein n=1 Tax=Strongylocentrotus purpuratus TaxID=7668 RepID=A0A7M7HNN8_STRPU|nr:uncharacterized protein LOC105441631 [Strongylocentrotus purpuratus]|eukprot:XP_011671234.1 PREDICTED: uncharacterized protein LOC105441631 [Strongylocentrotus purpuratus]
MIVSSQSGNGTLAHSSSVLLRPQHSVRNNLRSLLYSVAEGLNSEDLNKILFLTSDIIKSKPVKERIKSQGSSLDLLEVLLERDALDENNINVLFDLLSKIRRFDVLRKARTRWDQLKKQVNPDDQHAPCLVSSCHDGSDPSEPQHLSRPVRELANDGIVERRRLQFEEGLNKDYRPRGGYRGQHPTATDIDWNDEEVQELMKELFRPRSTPVNRNDGTREYHARCRYSPKAWRDFLTKSIAAGSYYCPTDEAMLSAHNLLLHDDGIIDPIGVSKLEFVNSPELVEDAMGTYL